MRLLTVSALALILLPSNLLPLSRLTARSSGSVVGPHKAFAPQSAVFLETPMLIDDLYGVQPADGTRTVQVGIPSVFTGEFDFSLPQGTSLPPGGLEAVWRSLTPSGMASAPVQTELPDGTLVPREWYVSLNTPPVQVLSYDIQSGLGRARIDIPMGRAYDSELYPQCNSQQGTLDILVGLQGTLAVDSTGTSVTGASFSILASFPTSTPSVLIDILKPYSNPGELLNATLVVQNASTLDRAFTLSSSVPGILSGLPAILVLPANDQAVMFTFMADHSGTFQILVQENGKDVGFSTLATASLGAGSDASVVDATSAPEEAAGDGSSRQRTVAPRSSRIANENNPNSPSQYIPNLRTNPRSLFPVSQSTSPFGSNGPSFGGDDPFFVDGPFFREPCYREVCCPAAPYGKFVLEECGPCHRAPLGDSQKLDCLSSGGGYTKYQCLRYLCDPKDTPTACVEVKVTGGMLPKYNYSNRSQESCGSASLSFGEFVFAGFGVDFVRSCCQYTRDQRGAMIPVEPYSSCITQ